MKRLPAVLRAWNEIPATIEAAIRGLSERELDLRGGPDGWSIRETVHHLVEANLVAAGMVVAALGASGSSFDWSWLNPDRSWMRRMGYDKAPVGPALEMLRALLAHLTPLAGRAGALRRTVGRVDVPGGKPRPATVGQIAREEVGHVRHHLGAVRSIRKEHGR